MSIVTNVPLGVGQRQNYNYQIYELIKSNSVIQNRADEIKTLIEEYPSQRFAQLICNYICPDYRSPEPSVETKLIMDAFFPDFSDPFFEESYQTYNRLKHE
jgi:hypothetical protein